MYCFPFFKHRDKEEKLKDMLKYPITGQYVEFCE